jgi:Putative beta-barrel porin 2
MKSKFSLGLFGLLSAASASAQGLYYVGNEAQESLPLKWVVGSNVIWDDNVAPGSGPKESSFAINPYVGLSFVNITPQTTWDVYVRLGLVYYFDQPDVGGTSDINSQSRAGINFTHRFNERLRFSSRNFIAYELEPDYSYGYASSRQLSEYFYWQTDNAVGYRWTERFATYTGFSLTGADYGDEENNNRFTWQLFNQARYQLGPQTVLTGDYRYAQTSDPNGGASDSVDQYLLAGVEQRFSPNTIGILRLGAQIRSVSDGDDNTSPYMELALNSQVNQQFSVRAFTRYGIESYDTVRGVPGGLADFSDRRTLRFGVGSEYALSPVTSIFGGVDYIPAQFRDGNITTDLNPGVVPGPAGDYDENIINAYIGVSVKFNDRLTGTLSYNYTHSDSDFPSQTYNRNRISLGLSAEF